MRAEFGMLAAIFLVEMERGRIAAAYRGAPKALSPEDIAALVAFLGALTDPVARQGRLGVPDTVPSGLPVPTP